MQYPSKNGGRAVEHQEHCEDHVRALVRVTDARDNKHQFLNPEHIRAVHEIPAHEIAGGSQITFSDGSTLVVSEDVNAMVAAIQGAIS